MRQTIALELPSGEIQTVQLPADVSLERLVPALVGKLGLPLVDEAGRSIEYELVPSDQAPLAPEQTLATAGIDAEARLRLQARPLTWAGPATSSPPARPVNPLDAHLYQPTPRRAVTFEESDADESSGGSRRALGFVLFLLYAGIRLLGLVFNSGSDMDHQVSVTRLPVSTAAVPTVPVPLLPTQRPLPNLPVDSPLLLGDHLYYLYEDEAGYALWQQDLDTLGKRPVRLLQLSETRGSGRELLVRGEMLYLPLGDSQAIWAFDPSTGQKKPLRLGGQLVYELPLALGDSQLFRGNVGNVFLPLYAARTVTETVALDPGSSLTPTVESLVITRTQVVTLPARVVADWQADQIRLGDVIYFLGQDDATGGELWRTDGTVSGTYLVRDINPDQPGSGPNSFAVDDSYLYFSAINGGYQRELWRSDGTVDGTVQVTDLRGSQSGHPAHLLVLDGELLFSALTRTLQRSLLHLQGSEAAPQLVPLDYDISAEWVGGQLVPFAGKLAFLVNEGNRTTLVLYDPVTSHSRQLWLPGETFTSLQAAGSYLLVRTASGSWYRLAVGSAYLQPLGQQMGSLVAVVPEPAGSSLLVDQQAYLWRLDEAGALHFLTDLAGTN